MAPEHEIFVLLFQKSKFHSHETDLKPFYSLFLLKAV
jgi:hypothetical protein